MEILKALTKEMAGLFVDDGSLAIAILVIAALSALIAVRFEAPSVVAAVLVFACPAILAENVLRTTRKRQRR